MNISLKTYARLYISARLAALLSVIVVTPAFFIDTTIAVILLVVLTLPLAVAMLLLRRRFHARRQQMRTEGLKGELNELEIDTWVRTLRKATSEDIRQEIEELGENNPKGGSE